jgi:cytochrome c oxidase cbb3-type subunit III
MSDFTSDFWDIYVSVITVVSIIACGVLLKMNSVRKVAAAEVDTTGHVWDEDLREYNSPLPMWWVWLFYITIVFSLVYLVLYPGLGRFAGTGKWTSTGQYDAEMKAAEAEFGPRFAKYAAQDIRQVAADPAARAIGQKLFLHYCSQCHASDAAGSRGFPNLTDRDWLYGGEPETIQETIANGRNGVMPAFGPVLGEQGVKDTAHFVRSLSGLSNDSARAARGKEYFAGNCAPCHGAEGKGSQQIGAPNLTDKIWLYDSSEATIIDGISKGHNDTMPAHKDFLGEAKVHLLAAYVWSLSNNSNVQVNGVSTGIAK